jgi:GT2 family glycosyltransferase
MSNIPLISVVVPTYQRRDSIGRLLMALTHQSLDAELFEVIVVIDGSIDGTLELVDHYQSPFSLRSIWQTNQGRATACNSGIRAAQGNLIVLLDDDMEPSPRLLEAHWKAHQGNNRLGVLGAVPIHLEPGSPPVMQFIGTKFNQHLDSLAKPEHTLVLRDFYSSNFSIRRSVLMEVGLFSDQFKVYGNEDLELAWRLRQVGIPLIYCSDALSIQHYEKDYTALAKDNIDKGKTSILFAKLHPEALPEIKLNTYNQISLKWRLMRSGVLFLSQIWKSLPQIMIRFMSWLEKRHPANLSLYYRLSLDYFYWLGVRTAQS